MESQVLHAKKLGLPDVILPNDVRNDLYVTIASGELTKCKLKLIRIIIVTKKIKIKRGLKEQYFCLPLASFKGGSSTKPNMEVTMQVCDNQGNVIPDALSHGETVNCTTDPTTRHSQQNGSSGLESTYRSVVHYHVGKITWNEVVKVSVKTEDFSGAHLRFAFRHCGRNDVKERPPPIAMAFLKLVNTFDGTAIKDGQHDLCVYKVEKHGRDFENGKYLGEEELREKANYKDKSERKQMKSQLG